MKSIFLFLSLGFCAEAISCVNTIPMSEAQKAIAQAPGAGKITCKDLPEEDCLCFDGVEWEAAIIVDEIVDGDPIYTINSQTICESEEDCIAKMQSLVCDDGFNAKYRMDSPQAFCERLDGYEQVQTGRKKLASNAAKLAAKAQREALKEQKHQERKSRKEAAKQELSSVDWSQITTIAKVRQVIRAVVDKLEEEE